MRDRARILAVAACCVMLLPMCGFAPNSAEKVGADFIVTAAPVYVPLAELRGGERFPKGAQLLLFHDGKAEPLVTGFAASADANVYFDGKLVLFAGKKTATDPWQIWEMTLADRSVRQVIETKTDAERPFYLPGGRMVWAERTAKGFELQSSEDGHEFKYPFPNPTAGPGLQRLTFAEASAFPTDVLKDGRILFESGFPLGSGSIPELYLVYADGSGVESYRCDHGRARWGGTQLASGDVVFTKGASLARFTSPLAHEEEITAPHAEYAGGIAETASGAWLVSTRTTKESRFEMKLWKPGAVAMETVLAQRGENLVEPVLVAPRTTPKRHPSGLHPWSYANLLALDSRLSREGDLKATPASVRVEAEDAEGHAVVMGTAPVYSDGSFFVKISGDSPIRFSLLDEKGAVLRREKGFFWARGGEQRICVGCHTGPERSAENRVPGVLEHTTTPVDLTGSGDTHDARQTSPEGH
jgi:Hydrazine synthase alpha subunit middle domain